MKNLGATEGKAGRVDWGHYKMGGVPSSQENDVNLKGLGDAKAHSQSGKKERDRGATSSLENSHLGDRRLSGRGCSPLKKSRVRPVLQFTRREQHGRDGK